MTSASECTFCAGKASAAHCRRICHHQPPRPKPALRTAAPLNAYSETMSLSAPPSAASSALSSSLLMLLLFSSVEVWHSKAGVCGNGRASWSRGAGRGEERQAALAVGGSVWQPLPATERSRRGARLTLAALEGVIKHPQHEQVDLLLGGLPGLEGNRGQLDWVQGHLHERSGCSLEAAGSWSERMRWPWPRTHGVPVCDNHHPCRASAEQSYSMIGQHRMG